MSDFLLFLYPVTIVSILVAGARRHKTDDFLRSAWSLEQGKALQVFAALMVILHHMAQTVTNYGAVRKGPITLWNSFGILFTSVFFFFSGFGLFKSYRTKDHYLKGFLMRRLPKLLVPYFLTNILYVALFSLFSKTSVHGFWQVCARILGYPLLNGNAWFIVEIIFLYIAFYLCFRWSKSERLSIALLAGFTVLLVVFALLLGHGSSEGGRRWFMGEWWYNSTLIFIMGVLFAKNEDRLKAALLRCRKWLLPVSILLLVGWYFFEQFMQGRFGYYQEWQGHPGYLEKFLTLPAQVIFCALFVFVLLLINLRIEFKNPVLTFLGSISLEVYLIHELFRRLLPGGVGGSMPDFLYIGLVYILSVISASILSKVDGFLLKDRRHSRGEHT